MPIKLKPTNQGERYMDKKNKRKPEYIVQNEEPATNPISSSSRAPFGGKAREIYDGMMVYIVGMYGACHVFSPSSKQSEHVCSGYIMIEEGR